MSGENMPQVALPTGAHLYYETHGKGEAVVLIPSTGFSGEVWKPSQMPLADGAQLVLHDPRGCGRSTASQQVYTINQMSNDVIALLDELEIEAAHIFGHSMGGRIGLETALNFPGRVKSLIMAASGSGQVPRPGADCVPGIPHWLLVRMVGNGYEHSLREEYTETSAFFTDDYRKAHPERVEAFFQMVYPTHAKMPEYLHLVSARHNWEATHRLGDVQCPTLVLVGNNDLGRSNHLVQAEGMVRRIPGAELQVIEGQSHGFPWQVPEVTNDIIRTWVSRQSR
jgi:3-oxoadipate enol-lactonase